MGLSPERRTYMRNYMRSYRGLGRLVKTAKPFVGIDGEGGDVAGRHRYFLLRSGEHVLTPDSGADVYALGTMECLQFLAGLSPHVLHVGFFFDYDVTKILEDLPKERLSRLMNRAERLRKDGAGYFPLTVKDRYEIDYLPRKEFKVRRVGTRPWVVINDVGSFFQCRFTEALEKWDIGTPHQRDLIALGKEARGAFSPVDIDKIAQYNHLEIVLLQEMMEKFRGACLDTGYLPGKWQGPGKLAESIFLQNDIPPTREIPLFRDPSRRSRELIRFGQSAYYGGRSEIMAVGPIDQPVFQWDINSAYPFAMLKLPCLIHGVWTRHTGRRDIVPGELSLNYGRFSSTEEKTLWYGLPVRRKDGGICFPASGQGWYWSTEILSATHQRFDCDISWEFRRDCDCRPFEFVPSLYAERKRLGKNGAGIVLKLALNSLYGKMVQSVGSPKYSNPLWGSFITAHCRSQINTFIHSSTFCRENRCGQNVLMVATDSLCTTTDESEQVDLGDELGQWSLEMHPNGMFIIQPGLYYGSSGKHAKTRGVPLSSIAELEPTFRDHFSRMVQTRALESGDVYVPQQMFMGIRSSLHRKDFSQLGQWVEFVDPETERRGKRIRFDWQSKRREWPILEPTDEHSYIVTFPPRGNVDEVSQPYDKDIGGLRLRESLRVMFDDLPEWGRQIEPVKVRHG